MSAESIGQTTFLVVAWPRDAKPTYPGAAGGTVGQTGPKPCPGRPLADEDVELLTEHQILGFEPGTRFNGKLSAYATCFSHSTIARQNTQFCTTSHSDRIFGNDSRPQAEYDGERVFFHKFHRLPSEPYLPRMSALGLRWR